MDQFQIFGAWIGNRLDTELSFAKKMALLKIEAFSIDVQLAWVDLKLAWYLR